ncbi:MAG: thioredoxin domain-containing protein [Pseudomonadota bacterium]
MKKGWVITAIISSIGGAILSLLSTAQHFRIVKSGFMEQSYCAMSEYINCDIVNASSYSEFLGVPIAWWGFIFYLIILAFSIYIYFPKKNYQEDEENKSREHTKTIIFGMGVSSCIYSLFLAYIATIVLGAVCLECLGMYLCNILITISAYFLMNKKFSEVPLYLFNYVKAIFRFNFKNTFWRHIAVIAAFFAVGWFFILQIQPAKSQGVDGMSMDDRAEAFYRQSLHEIAIDPSWPVWGNPDAPVKIVEFSEFQCPFCRISSYEVRPFLQEFRKDIAYYFVNYPLDLSCNPGMEKQMHEYACEAARASMCALREGKFWPFHDELFRKARSISPKLFRKLAEENKMDIDKFETCMKDASINKQILKDINAGNKIYVNGTPTIFLNGRKITDWQNRKLVNRLVKEEIKKTKKRM